MSRRFRWLQFRMDLFSAIAHQSGADLFDTAKQLCDQFERPRGQNNKGECDEFTDRASTRAINRKRKAG